MPAVRGDGMRGLAVFISDIRNCKSKEAEIKRINKELANIVVSGLTWQPSRDKTTILAMFYVR